MIRAELIENTPCAANDRMLMEFLALPPNFEKLTHSAKTNAVALSGAPSHILTEFMDNRAKLNVLRSVKWPIRSVADGISTYRRFCRTADNRPFQPSPWIIRKWRAAFNHGQTFGLYFNHVHKDSVLLNCDDGWLTSEIAIIAMCLRNEQHRGFAFPNSPGIRTCSKSSITNACNPPSGDRLLIIPSPLRVPPVTIHLRAAFASSKLTAPPSKRTRR